MDSAKEWFAYALVGFFVGTVAFFMILLEEALLEETMHLTEHLIKNGQDINAWLTYGGLCALFGLIAGVMTTYYGPGASGSGVAEMIGYLNGVNYPKFICIPSLLTKIIGVSFAVSGRLCVGKEGPLAHIGSVIGNCVIYLPGLGFEHLRNDENKRIFIAAGASTGVAAAFGAPIGGALFCYELSQPNTFWKFKMIWKVFLSCSLGTFVLAVWQGVYH